MRASFLISEFIDCVNQKYKEGDKELELINDRYFKGKVGTLFTLVIGAAGYFSALASPPVLAMNVAGFFIFGAATIKESFNKTLYEEMLAQLD